MSIAIDKQLRAVIADIYNDEGEQREKNDDSLECEEKAKITEYESESLCRFFLHNAALITFSSFWKVSFLP